MSIDSNEHVTELIEPYLVGGLNAEQHQAFEAHVRDCAQCGLSLASAQAFNASISALLSDARPDADFEDRVLASFRKSARRPRLHPNLRRAAVGMAATVILGGAGYIASNAVEDGTLPLLPVGRYSVGTGQAISAISRDNRSAHTSVPDILQHGQVERGAGIPNSAVSDDLPRRVASALGRRVDPNGEKDLRFYNSNYSTDSPRERSGAEPAIVTYGGVTVPSIESEKLRTQIAVPDSGKLFLGGQAAGTDAYYFRPEALGRPVLDQRSKSTEVPTSGAPGSTGNVPALAAPEQNKIELKGATASAGMLDSTAGVRDAAPKQDRAQGQGGQKPPKPAAPDPATGRKVIRSGDMTFEVDSFDSTVTTLTKIVDEEGGYVSTTDSDKLANGKVKGTIVLRVPPDHLDTLVLKLRGIGDLKSQKINAQDITKQYTDLQSELRAARAMEDRLLEIIKNGKGEVKDLLEAEKQLGVWREKIEQVEGEIRYDDNLVSLSTLSVTLIEKDIKTAAYASETEQVTMALETSNVESAYDKAKEAIADAKGRIVQSDLQQHEAGQFSGTITAALPPDKADAVIARLRQLDGRVANFQRQRSQKNQEGTAAPLNASNLHREDVTLSLTMYNLANVEPRRTVTLLLAATSVDESYRKVLDAIASAGGRVVTASVNRGKPEQSTATVKFDVTAEKADVLLAAVRGGGDVVHSETSDNPDTPNVTSAKRGFVLTIESLAAAAPRETQQLKVAAGSVPDGFNDVLNAVLSKGGRMISSQLDQQDRDNITGVLEFEVSRDAIAAMDAAVNKAGEIIGRNVTRSQDTENTIDSKVRYHIDLVAANSKAAVGEEKVSVWNAIRHGLEVSGIGLSWSLTMIVIGFCFVAPWALLIWILWRVFHKRPKETSTPIAASP